MKRLPITGNYPVVGSLCTSIELCIHINADARFQFNCDAVIPDVYKNCANHDCLHSLLPPLVKKIIVVISCKVRFSRCLTAKRLAITNLLQIVKAAGDAFIARAVKA